MQLAIIWELVNIPAIFLASLPLFSEFFVLTLRLDIPHFFIEAQAAKFHKAFQIMSRFPAVSLRKARGRGPQNRHKGDLLLLFCQLEGHFVCDPSAHGKAAQPVGAFGLNLLNFPDEIGGHLLNRVQDCGISIQSRQIQAVLGQRNRE